MTSVASIQVSPGTVLRPTMRIMDPVCEPGWDKLIAGHSDATFFHTASWARTLAAAYGFKCRYIAATAGEELHALLPLIEARSWLRGTRGVSLPFTDECPALLPPSGGRASPRDPDCSAVETTADDLLNEAVRQGAARGWKHLELRGGLESFHGVPDSSSYYGHVLELGSEPDQLLASCDSAVRRAVRKSEREGVTVEFGTDVKSVRAYYKLHCRTRAKHGAPPQPWRFFEAICAHVLQTGHGFVSLAKYQDKPIAGAVFFHFGGKAIYKFSASDERFQHLRGANLVIWSALQKLIATGTRELNFGRTSVSNEGLRRFKLGWGSREYMIRYARYSFSPAGFVTRNNSVDPSDGSCTRFLALVPVGLSRWIGRAVYPHLS